MNESLPVNQQPATHMEITRQSDIMITSTYYNDRKRVPKNVESVIIDSSVTEIDDYAFSGCGPLASIVVSNGVTSIGSAAFRECTSLASIVIPNNVTSIGKSAFNGCTSLTSIVIPNSVTSIGLDAFL
jgi:hypothetical protein